MTWRLRWTLETLETLMKKILLLVLLGSCVMAAQTLQPLSVEARRSAFVKLIERARVPLAPDIRPQAPDGRRLIQEHVTFAADAKERVPTIIMRSMVVTGPRPG